MRRRNHIERSHETLRRPDVCVKETGVCILDANGTIRREKKIVARPEDLVAIPVSRSAAHLGNNPSQLSARIAAFNAEA